MTDGPILGAFRLDRPVARGGMAEVWAGTHLATGLTVSIKVITGDKAQDPYFRQAFRHEIRTIAGLDHPGVIVVLDHGQVGPEGAGVLPPGSPYLVMEHASGGSLREARRKVLVWPEIRTILHSLLTALGHAHARGIIHRDLKPGNVLVSTPDDVRPGLKLTDFGLARLMEDLDRPGSVEAVRGTLHYMAPEQCKGLFRDQGPWTDLYALGCIAYQLATGRPPFRGIRGEALMRAHVDTTPPPLPPRRGLPDGYAAWVERLLAKSPWERFQRAADAAWALQELPEPDDIGPTRWIFPALATTQGLSDDLQTDLTPRTPLPDEVDLVPDDATERLPALVGGPIPAVARYRMSGDAPPVPRTWREAQAPPADLRLVDAGLGLFGLRPIGLVGRKIERDRMWASLLDVSATRTTRCVLLQGETGIGISRLAAWMARRADELGAATVLTLTHEPADPPLRPLRRMLARLFGVTRLPRPEVTTRVGAFAARHGLSRSDVDALVEVLRPPRARNPEPPAARYALIRRLITALAAHRVLLLRVEDIQWGGDTAQLLASLLDSRASDDLPVLIVATARTGVRAPLGEERIASLRDHPRTRTLAPSRLSPAETRQLLHQRLGLCGDLTRQVEEMTRGNPLFAVQLVGDWAQRGMLVPGEDGLVLVGGAAIELPDDLHAIWARRIDLMLAELPDRARIQLERAATLGETVDNREWAAICAVDGGQDEELVRHQLVEALTQARMARVVRGSLRFSHPMLRESVLRRAREVGRLAEHHRLCADMLDGREGRGDADVPTAERLGRHRYAAGQRVQALHPLLEAAESWRRAGGHRESLVLVGLVQEILEELRVPDADVTWQRLVELRLVSHLRRGEYSEARAWTRKALELAGRVQEPEQAATLLLAVFSATVQREPETAFSVMDRVRRLLPDLVEDRLLLKVAFAEAWVARLQRRYDAARHWLTRAADLAQLLDEPTMRGMAVREIGFLSWLEGDLTAARNLYERACDLLASAGATKEIATTLNNLGECSRMLGDLDEAERFYRQAISLFDRAGASAEAPYPSLNLGMVLIMAGQHREALAALSGVLDEVIRQGERTLEATARVLIAPCCAALGDWPGWARQLDRLEDLDDALGLCEPDMARFLRAAADRALQARRVPEARRGYTLAERIFRRLGDLELAAEAADARASMDAPTEP